MSAPITFGIIGAGWRSEFFCRLAAMAPDRLRVSGVLVRRPEAAERMAASRDVPVVSSLEELLSARPEFVIAAVSWPSMPQVVAELVERGMKVLAETPPAPDAEGLRALWERVGGSGLVQVGEQYMLMPGHAARKKVVDSGAIGAPSVIEVASTHLYHAASMMRAFLGAGFTPVSVNARAFEAPLADLLAATGAWARGEAEGPYSLADACQDHILGLAIEESARTGEEVRTRVEAWAPRP